jgi:hypothetical protein
VESEWETGSRPPSTWQERESARPSRTSRCDRHSYPTARRPPGVAGHSASPVLGTIGTGRRYTPGQFLRPAPDRPHSDLQRPTPPLPAARFGSWLVPSGGRRSQTAADLLEDSWNARPSMGTVRSHLRALRRSVLRTPRRDGTPPRGRRTASVRVLHNGIGRRLADTARRTGTHRSPRWRVIPC